MKIGVISDTHGLLRPEVLTALAGVEQILHLGDVGKASILKDLSRIAPVTAVRGNCDREGVCGELPETEVALVADRYVYMLHDLSQAASGPGRRKICRSALRPLARAELLPPQGRALLQSRLLRPAPRPAAGFRGSDDGRRQRRV